MISRDIYFTYKIGMPLLNMCELSSQKDMKHCAPTLYADLIYRNIEWLSDFNVKCDRIDTGNQIPDSELERYVIELMVKQVREGIQIQREEGMVSLEDNSIKEQAILCRYLTKSSISFLLTI